MRRSRATGLLVVVAVAAALLVLLNSCNVSTHRLPRHAPVTLLGASERGGRSMEQRRPLEGRRELAATARRLGHRTPEKPPSPKPQGVTGMAMPVPPPPPLANE